jgi:hypothetical protein
MSTRIMARAVFSGARVRRDAAAAALRRAGCEVHRLGPQHPKLDYPDDDFIECVTTVAKDFEITVIDGIGHASDEDSKILLAVMHEVDGIVEPYDGICDSCEWIDADYVPFKDLFTPLGPRLRVVK